MLAYYIYKVSSELESIFKKKINSFNFHHGIATSPQTSDDTVFPKAAPRKSSPKDHPAPLIPSTQISTGKVSPGYDSYNVTTEQSDMANQDYNNKVKIRKNNGTKTKSTKAPQPPQFGKSSPNKKEKVNIKISNMQSSGTDYSTLERKKQ